HLGHDVDGVLLHARGLGPRREHLRVEAVLRDVVPEPALGHLAPGAVMGTEHQQAHQAPLPSSNSARAACGAQASAAAATTPTGAGVVGGKKRPRSHSATPTRPMSTGTSTSGPMTAAKATPK